MLKLYRQTIFVLFYLDYLLFIYSGQQCVMCRLIVFGPREVKSYRGTAYADMCGR